MKTFHRTIATAVTLAAVIIGCGSGSERPGEEAGQTSEAQCGNGITGGCTACYPNSASPLGGYYDCFKCAGAEEKNIPCTPPPPCGGSGEPCCPSTYASQPCNNVTYCTGGKCEPCGGAGEPCCTNSAACVGNNLVCNDKTCDYCGGHNELCCNGGCNTAPDVCDLGVCRTCLNEEFTWECAFFDGSGTTSGYTTPQCSCADAELQTPVLENANCWIVGCP